MIAEFFTDPVLRAPTIGSMLMGLSSALVGAIAFLRKRSLIGETLSHAAYPGVILGIIAASLFFPDSDDALAILILTGAGLTSLLAYKLVDVLQFRFRVKDDAALCFVLSFFFGLGILMVSRIQTSHAMLYRKAQFFLYGQTATMTDAHVVIYGTLALCTIAFVAVFFRRLQAITFDKQFSQSAGIEGLWTDRIFLLFLTLAIVVGIRCVGVVLMAGMLIAPAAAAKFLTKRLSGFFFVAGVLGISSAFCGNLISVLLPQGRYSLPTGPTILLTASFFCVAAFLLSPRKGLLIRWSRALKFRIDCQSENALKALWKSPSFPLSFWMRLWLKSKGWIDSSRRLTDQGEKEAEKIVRLHRLWEVYLVDYLGQGAEKVHRNAEELEHLLTPELEAELTVLLNDPKQDPHHQPIPPYRGPPHRGIR